MNTPGPAIQPDYIRMRDLPKFLGISKSFLLRLESNGQGPRKIKKGRTSLYSLADIKAWMDSSVVRNA
jgi:predicted DNA-binding transcriptional regulator AlpA